MDIQKKVDGTHITLEVSGRLDTLTSPTLQVAVLEELANGILLELDFSKLDYISSAGLRVLLMGEKSAKEKGATFRLGNLSPDVSEVLEMTGLLSLFHGE